MIITIKVRSYPGRLRNCRHNSSPLILGKTQSRIAMSNVGLPCFVPGRFGRSEGIDLISSLNKQTGEQRSQIRIVFDE